MVSAAAGDGDASGSEFTGRLVISNGSVFTEELLDRNSAQFKALAYDTEQKVQPLSPLTDLHLWSMTVPLRKITHSKKVLYKYDQYFSF